VAADPARAVPQGRPAGVAPERTGVFTSGLVWIVQERRIALFLTGAKHAGENLADLLGGRSGGLPAPIQMCDALSRNVPKVPEQLQPVLGNCNAHGRRHFVKMTPSLPGQCRFVLKTLGEVYGSEAVTRVQGLSPEERLRSFEKGRLEDL
jgi:hypothetical protein